MAAGIGCLLQVRLDLLVYFAALVLDRDFLNFVFYHFDLLVGPRVFRLSRVTLGAILRSGGIEHV